MRKDNFGICLSFYAVLAFVLAILGQTTIVALMLGFVIVVHKDQWLISQTMQAFFLSIVSGIIGVIVDIISPIYGIPFIGTAFSVIIGIITSIISIVIFIFAILAIVQVAKEQDANVPIAKGFVDKAFGLVRNVTYSQQPMQNMMPQQPMQNMAPQQPMQNMAPQQPMQDMAPQQPMQDMAPQQPIQENQNNDSNYTLN